MDTQDDKPTSLMSTSEEEKIEMQQIGLSSTNPPSSANINKEVEEKIPGDETAPAGSSLLKESIGGSSKSCGNEVESVTASGALHSSAVSVEGKEVIHQKEVTQLINPPLGTHSSNTREDSPNKKQRDCSVGSTFKSDLSETAENRKVSDHNLGSVDSAKSSIGESPTNVMKLVEGFEQEIKSSITRRPKSESRIGEDSSEEFGSQRAKPKETSPFKVELSLLDSSRDLASKRVLSSPGSLPSAIKGENKMSTKCKQTTTPHEIPQAPLIGEESGNSTFNEAATSKAEDPYPTNQSEYQDIEGNNERRAFFYISSSSIPGMDRAPEWVSFSDGDQSPTRQRTILPVIRQDSREPRRCLGSKRCHYIILVIALVSIIMGCVTYHLHEWGFGPKALQPIGASTAFLSFVVLIISAVYLNYLSNYPGRPIMPNYMVLEDADPMPLNRMSECCYVYRGKPASPGGLYGSIQSADALDRRGYGRIPEASLVTDVKESDESGPSGLSQAPESFEMDERAVTVKTPEIIVTDCEKDMPSSQDQEARDVSDAASESTQESSLASGELPPDLQSSEESVASDKPLLQKKV